MYPDVFFLYIPDYILSPEVVHFRKRKSVFSDIWTGSFVTFAKEKNTGDIYSWGLSNYYQLGMYLAAVKLETNTEEQCIP